MSGFQHGCRCKIYVDKSKLNDFISPSTMSTSRKDLVSCDVIIDQQFHIKAVHRKAVRMKLFCSMFKEGAVLIAFVLFPLLSFALLTHATHAAPELLCFVVLGEVSAFLLCPVWVVSTWTSLSGFPLQTDTELWGTGQPFLCAFLGWNESEVVFLVKREDKSQPFPCVSGLMDSRQVVFVSLPSRTCPV